MPGEVIIKVRDVSKSYRIVKNDPSESKGKKHLLSRKQYEKYVVFHDLNLDVCKGEVVGILGTNGCGKSTFLKMISKVLKPDTGTVQTKGKVVGILELSMGFHPDLSGYDNIFLRSELYGIPRSEVEKNIDRIVRYADLGDYIYNPVRTYSSGMRSRLAFSVMINVDADVYLIDEALSTGDAKFASKASEHLKNLVRQGKTIMLVSHSMGVIENTCDRAIWLCDHTIKMDGPAETVCAEYNRSLFSTFDDIMQLAEDGSSSAQYRLACCYRDGDMVQQNNDEYLRWLKESALREHTLAMAEYADYLVNEDPVGNRAKAAELYGDAAEKGNYEARRKYSVMVSDGYDDLDRLVAFYRQTASSGDAEDIYALGNLLYKTSMTADGYREAFRYLEASAFAGSADGMYLCGMMYRDGVGVAKDIGKAVEMLSKASAGGNGKAPAVLAMMYDEGKLVQRSPETAFRWYLMSAEMGNAKSQYQTALMYRDGIGTDKDAEKAESWFARYVGSMLSDFRLDAADKIVKNHIHCDLDADELVTKAAECGNFKAKRMVERKATRVAGSVKITDENFEAQKALADSGNPYAMYQVAMYYRGKGPEFKDQSSVYMNLAADNGSREAKYALRGSKPGRARRTVSAPKKPAEVPQDYDEKTADELYTRALEYKNSEEKGSVNNYRKYIRLAAEKGHPEAVKLATKWAKRMAKRNA